MISKEVKSQEEEKDTEKIYKIFETKKGEITKMSGKKEEKKKKKERIFFFSLKVILIMTRAQ